MDEKILNGIMIAVVYPAMIAAVGLIFVYFVDKSSKYKNSTKRIEHRIRK